MAVRALLTPAIRSPCSAATGRKRSRRRCGTATCATSTSIQQDSSTTRVHGGLGLGLAILESIVEMHGGAVFAESEGEGTGARFVVRLPVLPVRGAVAAASGGAHATPPNLHGRHVVVVEDDPDTRELLRTLLQEWGADVRTAASTREAIDHITRQPPDLLVCDIGLPGEDGYSLLRRVRALPPERGGNLPAVAVTAYASDEDRRRAGAQGFDRYIAKPFVPADIAAAIGSILGDLPVA